MIKDAKKEKGEDDFLGKIVLKLQVNIYINCVPIHYNLLQMGKNKK